MRFRDSIDFIKVASGVAAGAFFGFLSQIIAARELGVAEFGLYAAALSWATMFIPLGAFGVGGALLRVYAQGPQVGSSWLRPLLLFGLRSTFLATAISALLLALALPSRDSVAIAVGISFVITSGAAVEVAGALAQVRRNFGKFALLQVAQNAVRAGAFGLAVFLVSAELAATRFALLAGLASLVVSILVLPQILREWKDGAKLHDAGRDHPRFRSLLSLTAPFGIGGVLYLIYHQSGIFVLGLVADSEASGAFGAAVVVISAIYLLPAVVFQKFLLPRFHAWAYDNSAALSGAYRAGLLWSLILGIGFATLVFLSSSEIVTVLFGEGFRASEKVLVFLSPCILFRFVSSCAGAVASVKDEMKKKVITMGLVAAINVLLTALLGAEDGASGAAIALLVSECALMVGYLIQANRFIRRSAR